MKSKTDRRNFIKASAIGTCALGLGGISAFATTAGLTIENSLFLIGPMGGFSPHIGTLVSMLNYNRQTIVDNVESMSMEDLDYLHDPMANTMGALIMHLGATEKFYQINTFEGRQSYNESEETIWGPAMHLGDAGRKSIKGHDVKYYLEIIADVRHKTLEEFKNKDDKWLLSVDPEWSKEQPLNTYWKWFHVCEHESNHRGQIAWLRSRLPSAGNKKN